jgi:hypothetical protein
MWYMPREHGDSGEFVETVTLDDVRGVFDEVRGPVVLSADVADALDCSRETARRKLEELYEQGEVDRRKVSRRVIYWHTGGERTTPDERAVESDAEKARAIDERRSQDSVDQLDTPDLDDALAGWEPDTEADANTARTQTRRATAYLRDHAPNRFKRSDFVDALAAESSLGGRSWWERAVQPGLRQLADAGLIEYRSGYHDYRWIGSTDEPLDSDVYDPTEEFDP